MRHPENQTLRQSSYFPRVGRFSWQEASKIASNLLHMRLKLRKVCSSKTTGHDINYVRRVLELTTPAIESAVARGLLTPDALHPEPWCFTDENLSNFSSKYISIQKFSTESGYSLPRIRKNIKKLQHHGNDLPNDQAHFRIISIQTRDAVIDRIERTNKKRSHRRRPHCLLPRLRGTESGQWCSPHEAAQQWSIHPNTVKSLISTGLLACQFSSRNGQSYALAQTALDDFKRKYISVREAETLLKCAHTTTERVLKYHNILPITGPGVDDCVARYFLRSEVCNLVKGGQFLPRDPRNYCTNEEARRTLKITVTSLNALIRKGILRSPDIVNKYYKTIEKSSMDEYRIDYVTIDAAAQHLGIPKACLLAQLTKNEILPITGAPIRSHKLDVYRRADIANIFPEFREPIKRNDKKKSLIAISNLLSQYKLPALMFFRLFINSGFITPLGSSWAKTHVTRDDAAKISRFLDKYLTFAQADQYLGRKYATQNLISTGRLQCERPMMPFAKCRMVKRSIILEYVSSDQPINLSHRIAGPVSTTGTVSEELEK